MMRYGGVSIRESADGLVFRSPYDAGMVAALKAQIPHSDRKWDPAAKAWIVAPQHADIVAKLASQYLGVSVSVPRLQAAPRVETRLLQVEYLGAPKDRGTEVTSFAWHDGGWSVIFPLDVLQRWFCVESRPDEAVTLYAKLGLSQKADDADVKAAYRRLARQWHPDVCREPDAAEQFKAIKLAYDVLANANMRARYDAGLQLAAGTEQPSYHQTGQWRPPLRCGWLLVEGAQQVGRFVASRILQWEDITNERGEVAVAFWPAGGESFEVKWA